ncbi:MAG: CinA family protein [Clostridia bacterium]|nr:CinA family protein [Clostridia bacterium]MDD4571107.1 CinA family protein [Clostridia bacterium]
MNQKLVELLIVKGLRIACAESCTGGLLAGAITSVPGASECLDMAVVTYSNGAKHKLINVPGSLLETFGAVSHEVAVAMAEGILKLAEADIAVAITGIAGPGGGTAEKPVGLVFIGIATKESVAVTECRFKGVREEIRSQTVAKALELAYTTAKEE